jgi:hypothetical protein
MASNTVDLHLNIVNSLEKNLKTNNKQMSSFNDKLTESKNLSQKMSESFGGIKDNLKNSLQGVSRLGLTLQRILPTFGIIFGGGFIVDTVKEVFEMDQAMKDVAYQMGMGAQGATELKSVVFGVSQATGLATEKATELVSSLAQLHVPAGELRKLAEYSANFTEVTGASVNATTRMAGELSRVGKLGQEAIGQIMIGMVEVQRAFGISAAEMESLTDSVQETTKLLNQMNKSSKEIERFNKGVISLAGAFASAGIEAQEATKFINELLDPSRVEENAFLYSKLGVSLEDAFSGNVDPANLVSQFRNLGLEMKNMSGPAASAMAKSLGMPLQTLRQMAEIDPTQMTKVTQLMKEQGLDLGSALAKAQEGQEGAGRSFEDTINKLKGSLQPLINKYILPMIENFANFLEGADFNKITGGLDKIFGVVKSVIGFLSPKFFIAGAVALYVIIKKLRKKLFSMATDVRGSMNKAFLGTMEEGANKGTSIFKSKVQKAVRDVGDTFKKGFSEDIVTRTNEINKNLEQEYKSAKALKKERMASYDANVGLLKTEKEKLASRKEYLQVQDKLSVFETAEFNRISKRLKTIGEEETKLNQRRNVDAERFNNYRKKQLKTLSNDQLRTYKEEIERKKEISREEIKAISNRRKEIILQNKNLKVAIDSLEEKEKQGKLDIQELKRLQESRTWLEKNNQELIEKTNEYDKQRGLLGNVIKQESELNKVYKSRYQAAGKDRSLDTETGAAPIQSSRGVFAKGADLSSSGFRKAGSIINKGLFTAGQKFTEVGRTLKDKVFSKQAMKNNLGTAFKTGTKGLFQGIGNLAKGLGKMLGPMMLMGIAMKVLSPIIQDLQPVIDQLLDILLSIANELFKALMPPLLRILSALLPAIAALVNTLLPPILLVLGKLIQIISKLIEVFTEFARGINELPMVKGKLDGAIGIMETVHESLGDAGDSLVEVGKKYMDQPLINKTMVGNLQNALNNTADKIASGQINLSRKTAEVSTATPGMKTSTWTPADLKAGKTGIQVKEHAKLSTPVEDKQLEAQDETAANTGEISNKFDVLIEQNKRANMAFEKAMKNPPPAVYGSGGRISGITQ